MSGQGCPVSGRGSVQATMEPAVGSERSTRIRSKQVSGGPANARLTEAVVQQ